MLETEHATRGSRRAFVAYEDLLRDWEPEIQRVGAEVGCRRLADVDRAAFPQVDGFVDHSLHRNRVRWDDLDVPARVRDMAEAAWQQVLALATGKSDDSALDEMRSAYADLYREAESIAQCSVIAARTPRGPAKPTAPVAEPSLRIRVARRIPVAYRRKIRRAVRSLRGRA